MSAVSIAILGFNATWLYAHNQVLTWFFFIQFEHDSFFKYYYFLDYIFYCFLFSFLIFFDSAGLGNTAS